MMYGKLTRGACILATAWLISFAAAARASDQVMLAGAYPERLSFPESPAHETSSLSVAAPALPQPQAMVALPTPQFTGTTAVGAMAILLCCRKLIFRLVA